jgi:hypothetical protein
MFGEPSILTEIWIMYSALYRKLPGGRVIKTLCLVALVSAAVSFLFFVVFPFVETFVAEDPSIDA